LQINEDGLSGVYSAQLGDDKCIQIILESLKERPLARPRHRREDIKMVRKVIGWHSVDRICMVQDREKWQALVNLRFHAW
jgi:hypothetical protein